MIDTVDKERETEDVGEEDELLVSTISIRSVLGGRLDLAHLSHICTYLSNLGQEVYASHPLILAESGLPRKVVQMLYKSFENVLQPRILTLAIY